MKQLFYALKKYQFRLLATACFLSVSLTSEIYSHNITTFIPRSQGANTARELAGWQRLLYRPYQENYAAIQLTTEYTHSRDTRCLAQKLFSTDRLTFAGSQYAPLPGTELPPRQATDIIADYFGLGTQFHGTLLIRPKIENVIIDLNFYFGLNDWFPGLYFRIHTPITHTRWSLGLDDCRSCGDKYRDCTVFPQCYMYSGQPPMGEAVCNLAGPTECPTVALPRRTDPYCCPINTTLNPQNPQLNLSTSTAFNSNAIYPQFRNNNCTTQSLREALDGNFTFGDMVEPWKFGRFSFCPRSKSGLADIDCIVGLNMAEGGYGHFGLFGIAVFPTGSRVTGRWIFEPIVGNGRHWEAGIGLSTHLSLCDYMSPNNIGFYIEGYASYMFKAHQIRSFDFKNNGLLSRYMLLKEYDTSGNYMQRMISAINFATRKCEVKIGLQADVSAKVFAVSNCWEFEAGYNFYFRDREKICIKTDCPCAIDSRRFGIKGLQGVCCIQYNVNADNLVVGPSQGTVPLNATQNDATMFSDTFPPSAPAVAGDCEAPATGDCICLTWNSPTLAAGESINLNGLINAGYTVADNTTPATIISCADLDPCSAAQGRMMTHKIFFNIGYSFRNSCYEPFFAVGGEIEFDGYKHNALPQWGAWLKTGLMF